MLTSASEGYARAIRPFEHWSCTHGEGWRFAWIFSADDPAFEGHLPGQAVLPGAFLMEMAQRAAQFALVQCGCREPRLRRVSRFRFINPILPNSACTLTLLLGEQNPVPLERLSIALAFDSGNQPIARGMLEIVEGDNDGLA